MATAFEQYGFTEENKQYVKHIAIPSKRALDNREIRVIVVPKYKTEKTKLLTTLTMATLKYKIQLVDLTANRSKALVSNAVTVRILEDQLGDILSAADSFVKGFAGA